MDWSSVCRNFNSTHVGLLCPVTIGNGFSFKMRTKYIFKNCFFFHCIFMTKKLPKLQCALMIDIVTCLSSPDCYLLKGIEILTFLELIWKQQYVDDFMYNTLKFVESNTTQPGKFVNSDKELVKDHSLYFHFENIYLYRNLSKYLHSVARANM